MHSVYDLNNVPFDYSSLTSGPAHRVVVFAWYLPTAQSNWDYFICLCLLWIVTDELGPVMGESGLRNLDKWVWDCDGWRHQVEEDSINEGDWWKNNLAWGYSKMGSNLGEICQNFGWDQTGVHPFERRWFWREFSSQAQRRLGLLELYEAWI